MWQSLSGSFNVATHTQKHTHTVIGTRSHLPHFAALIQQPLDNPSQARDKRCRYPPAAPLSPTLTVNLHVHCTFRSSFHYVSLPFVSFRFVSDSNTESGTGFRFRFPIPFPIPQLIRALIDSRATLKTCAVPKRAVSLIN